MKTNYDLRMEEQIKELEGQLKAKRAQLDANSQKNEEGRK